MHSDSVIFPKLYFTECFLPVDGEMDIEPEEGEDGEELLSNGQTSGVSSKAKEKSEMPGCTDSCAASLHTENTQNLQRSIIEDIRSVLYMSSFRIIFFHIVFGWHKWTIHGSFSSDRKSEFGIGIELNAECQKLIQVQQERQGRSLDRLATELYSKDTHFVLELIQVASVFFEMTQNLVCQILLLFILMFLFLLARMLMTTLTHQRLGSFQLWHLW